ncbi:MAG: DNA translocase FtsK 4TM domain-containing protein, partial [Pseudomonadota bacterium]|nr:DNA translocase FtsK 4TM domain-containing protein [Pseudomonadota bacterium]
MTFPLGSLRADGPDAGARGLDSLPPASPAWRSQLALLAGAVVWLLAMLALATHAATDPGFSTSGDGSAVHNRAGLVGAWVSDLAFFLLGYSAWWLPLVAARAWLGALARALRASSGSVA